MWMERMKMEIKCSTAGKDVFHHADVLTLVERPSDGLVEQCIGGWSDNVECRCLGHGWSGGRAQWQKDTTSGDRVKRLSYLDSRMRWARVRDLSIEYQTRDETCAPFTNRWAGVNLQQVLIRACHSVKFEKGIWDIKTRLRHVLEKLFQSHPWSVSGNRCRPHSSCAPLERGCLLLL